MKFKLSLEAHELLLSLDDKKKEYIKKKIGEFEGIISREQIEEILKTFQEKTDVTIKRPNEFRPIAKEFEPKIKIDVKRDVTEKSRTKSNIEDFIKHFRNRFERISRLFPSNNGNYSTIHIEDINKSSYQGMKVRVICMIYDKLKTKKGNLMLYIEDLTGMGRAIIPKSNNIFVKVNEEIVHDDIIALYGTIRNSFLIVDSFEFPISRKSQPELDESRDLAIAYISDTHIGSKYFIKDAFIKFIKWLNGEINEQKHLAGMVKYVVIAGDIVDGIGIYPNQEKELIIKDVYEQYELFESYISKLPDYIEVLVIPGNHDAVRRGEPSPALSKDMIHSDKILLGGNPIFAEIEGLKHLIYHGTSMDSLISAIPKLNYEHPEEAMAEMLKRRHLSTIYGSNPIVPEMIDYMVIDLLPDVFHAGHVHKNGYKLFRGTLILNTGTFQERTPYQIKMGHIPTPGEVYVYRPIKKKLNSVRFYESWKIFWRFNK